MGSNSQRRWNVIMVLSGRVGPGVDQRDNCCGGLGDVTGGQMSDRALKSLRNTA